MALHLHCELSKIRRSLRKLYLVSRRNALPQALSWHLNRSTRTINSLLNCFDESCFPTSVSNFELMADGHDLVPQFASTTADGRHDTYANSSIAVVIHQDTDGANVLNTRPPTLQNLTAREPRDTSPSPSVISEKATI